MNTFKPAKEPYMARLRDRFATAAMQSILMSTATSPDKSKAVEIMAAENGIYPTEEIAKISYQMADRMIAARKS